MILLYLAILFYTQGVLYQQQVHIAKVYNSFIPLVAITVDIASFKV